MKIGLNRRWYWAVAAVGLIITGCHVGNRAAYAPTALHSAQVAATQAAAAVASAAASVDDKAKNIQSNATKALQSPTTQAASPYLHTIWNDAADLLTTAANLTQANATILSLKGDLAQSQKDSEELQAAAAKEHQAFLDEQAKANKYQKQWDESWFAGKTHVFVAWVVGIGAALIVADIAMYFFLGVGINPISLGIRLFGSLFQNKTLGGTPKGGQSNGKT